MVAKSHAILTSVLEGANNQLDALAILPQAKSLVLLLIRSLFGLHDRSERLGKGLIAPALNRKTILYLSIPLDSHRINWAISVPVVYAEQYEGCW
jgi:hypothetical protein